MASRKRHLSSDDAEETIKAFEQWLPSIEGKSRSKATAQQYANQMRVIIGEHFGGNFDTIKDYKDLAKPGGLWENFKTTKSTTTVQTYMHSLKAFFEFIEANQGEDGKMMTNEECKEGIRTVQNWVRNLHGLKATQHFAHLEREERAVPRVAEMMKKYHTTKHHSDACAHFLEWQLTPTLSKPNTFLHCRNDIIMRILLRNGQRTGTISNATMGEYRAMQEVEDHYIMKVCAGLWWS